MVLIIFLLLTIPFSSSAQERVIRMGYRTTDKFPYINEAPNNEGLFKDLYSEAARRVGYKLEIVREPKKRVLLHLKEGNLEFYPGFAFNMERAEYSIWFKNGIKQRDVTISREELHSLDEPKDLKGLVYLKALGNPEYLTEEQLRGVKVITVAELDVERAIKMILNNRADFYIYEDDTMRYFVKSRNIDGIKFHDDLITRFYIMTVGFSRFSPLYEGGDNHDYDTTKVISKYNFPFVLTPGSVPDKFRTALDEMYREGYTDSLYNVYFK